MSRMIIMKSTKKVNTQLELNNLIKNIKEINQDKNFEVIHNTWDRTKPEIILKSKTLP